MYCYESLKLYENSFIHSRIYKEPLKEMYSEAHPTQPRRYKSVISTFGLEEHYEKMSSWAETSHLKVVLILFLIALVLRSTFLKS